MKTNILSIILLKKINSKYNKIQSKKDFKYLLIQLFKSNQIYVIKSKLILTLIDKTHLIMSHYSKMLIRIQEISVVSLYQNHQKSKQIKYVTLILIHIHS